jgi:hypothetical protein
MLSRLRAGATGAVAATLALVGCAPQTSPHAPAAAKPAMWRVADEDTTIYMFGTIHLLPQDRAWRTPAFDRALSSSQELVLEIANVDDAMAGAAALHRLGTSPGLPPLRERVPESKRAALDAMVAESGIPAVRYDGLETWAAGIVLMGVMVKRLGVSAEAGPERILTAGYKAEGKPIHGLETVEQQFSIFDALPEEEQRLFLEGVLESPDEMRDQFQKMLDAWLSGDEAAIAATFDEEAKFSPKLREVLLAARNRNWADWVDSRMDRPGTVFLAVGAGHLAGRDSVQSLLASRGLKSKRIQ